MESVNGRWEYEDPLYNALSDARLSMHIPALADAWLGLLAEDGGLPDVSATVIIHKGKPLCRPILEDPVNTPSDPSTYPARLDNGQVIWVRLDKRRSTDMRVSAYVADKPDSVGAVLAALTMMEGKVVDIEELRRLLLLIDLSHPEGISESVNEVFADHIFLGKGPQARRFLGAFPVGPVRYALALLRYYRPGFDALPEEKQRALLIGCCERINTTVAAIRQLTGFLEYGAPYRDQRPAIENPHRDVEATVMRDVEKGTYRKIAARLRIEVSEKARHIGDYSTVSKAVARGRDILARAFGEDGWEKAAAEMRSEHLRRDALSELEKYVEDLAEHWRVSPQAMQSILEGEDPTPDLRSRVDSPEFRLASKRNYYEALARDEVH